MPVLVPIPSENLEGTASHWLPFVEGIAQRTGCTVDQLVSLVANKTIHLILVWDDLDKKALALCGVSIIERGDKRIMEVNWLTGEQRHLWVHLLNDLETYAKAPDGMNCRGMKVVARPGWKKTLRGGGYTETHVVMERTF